MKCKSCGASIRWARTESGKQIPLDPDPTPEGNLIVLEDRPGLTVKVFAPLVDARPPAMYVSHFATCPFAKQHRRG